LNYVKNKGQWDSKVLYRSQFRGGVLWMENTAFTFLFFPPDGFGKLRAHHSEMNGHFEKNPTFKTHAIRMEFENASPDHTTETAAQQDLYYNYFLGKDKSKWASNVPVCKEVIYKNLYPGIDVKTFSSKNDVRYDFIVSANADPTQIQLKFIGQDKLTIREGKLIISTSVGDITQQEPVAYQEENGSVRNVNCHYVLEGNKLGIKITSHYNKNIPLIIDPTLVFATYTGSTADNWGMSASYDVSGNAYTAGIVFNTGYPVTTGAYMSSFQGGVGTNFMPGFDISISKFNSTGSTLMYSTYLGGSDNESPQSITVDNASNLIVLGRTYSTDYPTVGGCFDVSQNGMSDIVVTKFNSAGSALLASTYVGGSQNDGINYDDNETVRGSLKFNYADDGRGAVHVDQNNNVYVTSCTMSGNFPVSPGCYQSANAGLQDGCVFKMDPGLTTMLFSTYLGGNQNDACYNLAIDPLDRVYVTGGTESPNFPVTAGALITTYGGSIDGFITHFSSNGNSILQSSFIGTSGYDQSYFVQLDKLNNVYLYGQSSGNYPVVGSVYSNPNSSQFIHKLNPNLSSTLFSTRFGSGRITVDIVPSAFLVDNCQNIYISGWGGSLYGYNGSTSSTMGLPVTGNAFQSITDGADFYFAVFTKNAAALLYASYFGGSVSNEHVDGGTSCFDKKGVVYQAICESCGGHQDMPSTGGVWSNVNGSSNCNNAVVKFKLDSLQTVAQLNINPFVTTGCLPFTVNFLNNSANAVNYNWNFGDGNTSTAVTPAHTYTNVGTFTVQLIASDSSTCNRLDTTWITITVKSQVTLVSMPPKTICKGDTAQLQATSPAGTLFSWSPGSSLSNINISNPKAFPQTTTIYTVTAHDPQCATGNTGTVSVTVNENKPHIVVDPKHLCIDDTVKLSTSTAYPNYSWNTGQSTQNINVLTAGLYSVTTIDLNGCKGSDTLTVHAYTHLTVTPQSGTICAGQSYILSTVQGDYKYEWYPSGGLSDSYIYDPTTSPKANTVYTVLITNGPCVTKSTYSLTVNPKPTLTVTASAELVVAGEEVQLIAQSNLVPYWWPNIWLTCDLCDTSIATPDGPVTYYCAVMNEYGCFNTDSVKIQTVPTFYIPNSFTPDGNGLNDIWRPVFTGYTELSVRIFDRWGEELCYYNELEGGWDGTYRGGKCKQDVYVYKIIAKDYLNHTIQRTGTITLLRRGKL
jgi:gliding motility-associated-like protein